MFHEAVLQTPLGRLGIISDGRVIRRIDWLPPGGTPAPPNDGLAARAARILQDWFSDPHAPLDLPLAPAPTDFQRRVRSAMQAIPPGSTRTYGEIARELGSSARAVGGACRDNPLPIIVPCHRVVGRHGLGGYSGDWECGAALTLKQGLLDLEAGLSRDRDP